MDVPARLGCTFAYGRVLEAAYSEDLMDAKQRREAQERAERVVAKVDRWLHAGEESAAEGRRPLLSAADLAAAGADVIGVTP